MAPNLFRLTLIVLMLWAPAALAAPPHHESALLPADPGEYRRARMDGGPGKDGIPSVDRPRFGSAAAAERFLEDDDRVIGLYLNGQARAYPQRILVWHEIVNDSVGDHAVAVTYCPLTGTAIGFDRGGTEFGVSGKLVNSNLVMYDRATDTEYPQILAAGIDGELTGRGLEEVRLIWTTWERWKARHPDTGGADPADRCAAQLSPGSLRQLQPARRLLRTGFPDDFPGAERGSKLSAQA